MNHLDDATETADQVNDGVESHRQFTALGGCDAQGGDGALTPAGALAGGRTSLGLRFKRNLRSQRDSIKSEAIQSWQDIHEFVKSSASKVCAYIFSSLIVLSALFYFNYFAAIAEGESPELFGCRQWAYWPGPNCGVGGINCRPFESEWFSFRCAARCNLNNDPTLRVWGTDVYRGDSRICKAALHAGVISRNGGCARMRYSGPAMTFVGSERNSVATGSFDSWFPKTFEFLATENQRFCTDITVAVFITLYVSLAGLAVFQSAPQVLWFSLVFYGYWFICFFSAVPSSWQEVFMSTLTNSILLLPASLALYRFVARHTLSPISGLKSMKKRVAMWTLFYLTPFMITLNMDEITRIFPELNIDLSFEQAENAKSSSWTYLFFAIVLLLAMGLIGWHLWKACSQKMLLKMLGFYMLFGITALSMVASFPGYGLHMHHASLAVLLLPLTQFSGVASMASQSLLLGVFLNGYGIYGWENVFEKPNARLQLQIPETPIVFPTVSSNNFSVTVAWSKTIDATAYSVQMNNVEMCRVAGTSCTIELSERNLTYYFSVGGVGAYGVDGVHSYPAVEYRTPSL